MARSKSKTKVKTKTVALLEFPVETEQRDIDEGVCRLSDKCMEKIAITRALIEYLGLSDKDARLLRVKIDNSGVRFIYANYRWYAPAPTKARNALIVYDDPKRGPAFVKPHRYTVKATRGTRVEPFTRERKDQINAARLRRVAEGRPDKVHKDRTIHQRVVGLAEGYG